MSIYSRLTLQISCYSKVMETIADEIEDVLEWIFRIPMGFDNLCKLVPDQKKICEYVKRLQPDQSDLFLNFMQINYPKVCQKDVLELYEVLSQMFGSHITKTYTYHTCSCRYGSRHHFVEGAKPNENWETLILPRKWIPMNVEKDCINRSEFFFRLNYNHQVEYGTLYRQSIAGLYERSSNGFELDTLKKQGKKIMYKLEYYCTHFTQAQLLPPSDQIAVIRQLTGHEVDKCRAFQLITALASNEWHQMPPYPELKQFVADKYHPFELILRGCASLFNISAKLPIDYKGLVSKMQDILGAPDHILIDVCGPPYSTTLDLMESGHYYDITMGIAHLVIDGDIDFYGVGIYEEIWDLIKPLPLKLRSKETGEISNLILAD